MEQKTYTKMWYKNTYNVAIRQNFHAKQQIISCGGKACKLSRARLEALADQCIAKLESGEMSEVAGKKWLRVEAGNEAPDLD